MNHINKIQDALGEYGLDGMLLLGEINRRYATGFPASDGAVAVTRREAFFFTDSRYIEAASDQIKDMKVSLLDRAQSYPQRIQEIVKSYGIQKLGFEDRSVSFGEYQAYQKALGCELVPAETLMRRLRAVKSEEEQARMISAQRIAERALDEVLGLLTPDMTEREVAAELCYRMLKNGAEKLSFDPIVVSGEKTSMPHGVPGGRKLVRGGFLTMDFGCVYDGYCSDMTRTVAIGGVTEEMKRVYETVLEAQRAGMEAARAGIPGSAVDAAARDVIARAGYGEYFGHGFGHGIGLEVHEWPGASPSAREELLPGTVISAEPGIYLPGRFGVRIEDVIVIRETGCETIARAPKELLIL